MSIQGVSQTVGDAFNMLSQEFNSIQHQTQTREYLYSLNIDGAKSEKNCTTADALELVHERILERIPQCGPDNQKDSHMSDFLYLFVKGHPWARDVLSARGAAGQGRQHMDYNTFYNRWTAAVNVFQQRS